MVESGVDEHGSKSAHVGAQNHDAARLMADAHGAQRVHPCGGALPVRSCGHWSLTRFLTKGGVHVSLGTQATSRLHTLTSARSFVTLQSAQTETCS
jgi:hypothetical protein